MRTTIALCLAALTLGACGAAPRDSAKDFKGEQRNVANAVEDLESAARSNKPGDVCSKLLDPKLLAAIKAHGTVCATGAKDAFKDADSLDLTVDAVTISGTSATAKVTAGSGSKKQDYTLGLVRDAGVWKISSLR